MADPTFISQEALEAAADEAGVAISQETLEVGADDGSTAISQLAIEAASDDAGILISQLCIEYALGGEAPPPPPPEFQAGVFEPGLGTTWFLIPQLSDSGIELRDKQVKSVRVTGKHTDAQVDVYAYGPIEDIDVEDIEDGINPKAGPIALPDTTHVQQSQRFQCNVPNAMVHTVRISGEWDGEGIRDRIDEAVIEVAQQGVRR